MSIKDYDIDVLCHPGRANVVADVVDPWALYLTRGTEKREVARELNQLANLGVRLLNSVDSGVVI